MVHRRIFVIAGNEALIELSVVAIGIVKTVPILFLEGMLQFALDLAGDHRRQFAVGAIEIEIAFDDDVEPIGQSRDNAFRVPNALAFLQPKTSCTALHGFDSRG